MAVRTPVQSKQETRYSVADLTLSFSRPAAGAAPAALVETDQGGVRTTNAAVENISDCTVCPNDPLSLTSRSFFPAHLTG